MKLATKNQVGHHGGGVCLRVIGQWQPLLAGAAGFGTGNPG